MSLDDFIGLASERGASDLHLEAGMPPTLRVRGSLQAIGEPVPGETLLAIAQAILSKEQWKGFVRRRSADLAKTVRGVRCRINILQSTRGTGLAVRLLHQSQPTLEQLNLHPDLARLAHHNHGLILVSGPTGSGKSSTLAALVHELNSTEARHIVTLERPVEFVFRPRKAFIRQREVEKDTPSFSRGLLDAMREDPDVLMVGEMRHPETVRLTLNAAETGHLVLSTVHSATVAEALHRVVSAFPSEIQPLVCSQLADCLRAVICQRLTFKKDLEIRVPECQILIGTTPAKSLIRQGHFFKLEQVLETGARQGQFTLQRYRSWLAGRTSFHVPDPEARESAEAEEPVRIPRPAPARTSAPPPPSDDDDVIVIQPPTESLADILDELNES